MATRSWQRTAEYYRALGYMVAKTEYHSRGSRHDLMGFVDGIAYGIGHTIYLQACGRDWGEHLTKITGPCREKAVRVLMAGNRLVLIGWRKTGPRGRRKTWQPRIHEFGLDDFLD